MKKKQIKKQINNDCPHPLSVLSFVAILIYTICLVGSVAVNSYSSYDCEKPFSTRLDYIFPAKGISCYLNEELEQ